MIAESAQGQTVHLSDEALDDILLDVGSDVDAAHVATCQMCADRMETFLSPMARFNQASSAWSTARSNSIPRELTPRWSPFSVLPVWSVAAAFFLAVALSFLVGVHRGMAPTVRATAGSAPGAWGRAAESDQEIASDNDMLHAIDTAISQPVPSPVEVYDMEKTTSGQPRRLVSHEVQD